MVRHGRGQIVETKQATQTETGGKLRLRILTLIVAIAAMGATLTAGTQPSSAATQSYRSGSTGRYTVSTVGNVRAEVWNDAFAPANKVAVRVYGPNVWPSVAGSQYVTVTTELWHYTTYGAQVRETQQLGDWVASNGASFRPTLFKNLEPGTYYTIRQYITWQGGGFVQVDFNHPSDYVCTVPNFSDDVCATYGGWIRAHGIGSYGRVYR
jgi:hypothetical protein